MLGLDIGDKRIGVAITDELNEIAYPLTVVYNDSETRENLIGLINRYNIGRVIVGLPYNLKGEEGFQAKRIRLFIEENFKGLKVPVAFYDERFSSKISGNITGNKKPEKKRRNKKSGLSPVPGEKDKVAAAIILNDYMELEKNKKIDAGICGHGSQVKKATVNNTGL